MAQARTEEESWGLGGLLLRFVLSAVVLAITAFFTPGFRIAGIWALILGAAVIAIIDYAVARIFKFDASPFGKGITGFIISAIIIYVTQFFVAGFSVTILGAIIGALVYGIVDAIIPGKSNLS